MPRKFLCTGDQHVHFRREAPLAWQFNRYMQFFELMIELCLHHHADLIITGDFFEKCEPELEEQQLAFIFFRMLKEAGIETYLISGNHCAIGPGRDTFQYLDMGKDKTIKLNYQPKPWTYEIPEENCTLHFLSHCNLGTYQGPTDLSAKLNILISHFRCNYNQFVKEEIDVDNLLGPFDLALCGDIHGPYSVGKLVYTNAPINKEFQTAPETGVVLLTIDKGVAKYERIATKLPSLIQIRMRADEPYPFLNDTDFYRIEVTGTVPELKLISAPAANVKLVKVPEALEVLVRDEEGYTLEQVAQMVRLGIITEMEAAKIKIIPGEATRPGCLDEELAAYLVELGMSEPDRDRMMTIYKEAA